MKAIDILVNSKLPPKYRGMLKDYDAKSVGDFLKQVAADDPDAYPEVMKSLGDVGRSAVWLQGDTLRLADLRTPFDRKALFAEMDKELDAAKAISVSADEFKKKRQEIWMKYNDLLQEKTTQGSKARNDTLYHMIASGARGKPAQHKLMVGGTGLFEDPRGGTVPIFGRHNYSEGIRPIEYLAATYGARSSVISTKVGTAKGGDIGKQLAAIGAYSVISTKDCGTHNGVVTSYDDPTLRGRVLAADTAGIPAGTLVNNSVLERIRKAKPKNIFVRTPFTCAAEHGLCAKCAGANEKGDLPQIGDYEGLVASTATGEPVTQGALCLAEGTLVRMSTWEVKKIEHIIPGEWVMGVTIQGKIQAARVLATLINGERPVLDHVFYCDGEERSFGATKDHKVLSKRFGDAAILPVGEATVMSAFISPTSEKPDDFIFTRSENPRNVPTYDLTVDNASHLFLLANGMVVSNSHKHTAGAVQGERDWSGIKYIQAVAQMPEDFPDKATVSEEDGVVGGVREAEQGGFYVTVGNTEHYIPQGQSVLVKPSDKLEAGDVLSDGLLNPADIVRLRGIGDGRRAYVDTMAKVLTDNKAKPHMRHLEILARKAIDHVDVGDEGVADYLPGDTVSYTRVANMYVPPETAKTLNVSSDLAGKYLQEPVLGYTIGTKLRPRMIEDMRSAGYTRVMVDDNEPSFTPTANRLRTATAAGDDWLAKQHTSYLKTNLLADSVRGRDTNIEENEHFAPRLMYGVGFGDNVHTTGKF